MTSARDFDLSDILTITEGSLVGSRHIDGVYDILNFMTGDSLFTHQLPRAAETCQGPLVEQHPRLAGIRAPWQDDPSLLEGDDPKAVVEAWVARMKAIHGDTLSVTPLAEWHHMDPIQELVEMTERPDRIIAVSVD